MIPTFVAPRTILLIDDHAVNRQVLAQLLRATGHRVMEADGGFAGLTHLRQAPPDLVVTARDMPGLTGWDVAQHVKAAHPRVPVVLVTGGANADTADCGARAHVDAVLREHFPVLELLVLIARLTNGAAAPVRSDNVRELCPVGHSTTGSILRR
jgi:CheY-like chemotaxis protein